MVKLSNNMDVDDLISYSDDLTECLRKEEDIISLKHYLEQSATLRFHSDSDFDHVHSLIQDFERKIAMCKQKTEEAKADVVTDVELEFLEKELDYERTRERLLKEELRAFMEEMNNLEHQRLSVEEEIQNLKRLEQDSQRAERMLSMYASVTKIIPDLDDQIQVSGCIVERDQNLVDKFEYDPVKMSSFHTCNVLWERMDP